MKRWLWGGKEVSLVGRDGSGTTIIDGSSGNGSVIALIDVGGQSIVQGFTIRDGLAFGGGGIFSYKSSPTIVSCVITNNSTRNLANQVPPYYGALEEHGGGILCYKGGLTVRDCTITRNVAMGHGGGIFCGWDDFPVTITNSIISDNISTYHSGGGIACFNFLSSLTISNCTITGNSANNGAGGGIKGPSGNNTWFTTYANLTITDSVISGNTAKAAGGILCTYYSTGIISNCEISDNTSLGTYLTYSVDKVSGGGITVDDKSIASILNCLITDNTADVKGGGGVYVGETGNVTIVNSTFNGNTTPGTGGAIYPFLYGTINMVNSILWGNTASGGADELAPGAYSSVIASYSDIRGGWAGMGTGNINVDPLFVNPGGGDYRLQPGSPGIDAASSYDPATANDIEGNSRFDDPLTNDTGVGINGPYYDMGAYEYRTECVKYVPDDYSTIQDAIDGVGDGCEIIVRNGTYTENLVFNNRAVILRSENGPDFTTINGGGSASVVSFTNNDKSVLEGFTITGGGGTNGGGIYSSGSQAKISKCVITANTASLGGGIYCITSSSLTITNCTIVKNTATGAGGGIYSSTDSSPTIVNCTITDNSATDDGGGVYYECYPSHSLTMVNSILWGNKVDGLTDTTTSLFVLGDCYGSGGGYSGGDFSGGSYFSGGSVIIAFSDIHGGHTGYDNIDTNPLFVDAADGDYHLQDNSPLIDAGTVTPATFPYLPADDSDGDIRPRNNSYDIGSDENLVCLDMDNDGVYDAVGCGIAVDCDDNNPNRYPGNPEVCNGVDNDCDGTADDNLGTTTCGVGGCEVTVYNCSGGVTQTCTPGDPNPEVCDGVDNDCNPATADGAEEAWLGTACDGTDSDLCIEGAYECTAGAQSCTDTSGDTLDICDGIDNDCDYILPADEFDDDSDDFMVCEGDCDDNDPVINPSTVWYKDSDGDGYSDEMTLTQCARPINYYLDSELIATSGDCNDNDDGFNPDACDIKNNGLDEDCDTFDRITGAVCGSEPEVCDDGIDNDLDGLMDCADSECNNDPACVEVCDDGIDNDVDGNTDCADPDCNNDPACDEVCNDGIDNDLDGNTDCDDSDCNGDPACGGEICDDGIDNDLDSKIDCDDPDCNADPACGAEVCDDGIDNDLDGNIDCADPDCNNDPACVEVCDDGIDNDLDGNIDCNDSNCKNNAACQ